MKPSPPPLVTIGISTYNRANEFLPVCLQSAVAQGYANLEILVSDNASSDDTEGVVKRLADARVRYVKQPRNLGANGNFNYCLDHARGEFFLLLHDDDLLDPDMIERCAEALGDRRDVGMIRTGTRIIDGEGHVRSVKPNRVAGLDPADFLLGYFAGHTSIYFASTLFHTQRLREAGGIDSRHNLLEDGLAVTKLLAYPRVDLEEVKASFRRHGDNQGTGQQIRLWCEDARDLLDAMVDAAGRRGPEVRQAGLRFFSHQNYSRLHRAGTWDPRTYHLVHRTFDRALSPLAYWLSRFRKGRLGRGWWRRLRPRRAEGP